MAGSLGDRYQKRLDAASKRGKSSFMVTRTVNGKKKVNSAINQNTVNAIYGDENVQLIVQENNARIISEAINDAIVRALEEIGLVAEGAAKRLCPVDTGRLRNSITHALMGNDTVIIGTNVEYGPIQELGGSRRKAANGGKGFLRPAVANNQSRFEGIMRKHLSKS